MTFFYSRGFPSRSLFLVFLIIIITENRLHLCSAFLSPEATHSALQYCLTFTRSCTHSHTDGGVSRLRRATASSSEAVRIGCFVPGQAGNRISNLAVTSKPALPPELLPHLIIIIIIVTVWLVLEHAPQWHNMQEVPVYDRYTA